MAGLGASLAKTGAIEETAMQRALVALARFRHLCCDMEVEEVRCAATAAVRDSSNGPEFIRRAEALGLKIDLLSGQEERSEEHTSELQSLMSISYAVFCLTKKNDNNTRSI